MDRATKRSGTAGLSLVELLVVLGIIGVISAVLIPSAIRGGWFTSSRSALAARELFTLEKAARVYASTYNIETAVAYGVQLIPDTQQPDQRIVPVATEVALARRLKRAEIVQINIARAALGLTPPLVPDGAYFVPLVALEGAFRTIPKDMCILPDLFEVDDINNPRSQRGLMGIQLYDTAANEFYEARYYDFGSGAERLDYVVDGAVPNFPAHRYQPDGSVRTSSSFTRQRFIIRVGARPDALFKDRFTVTDEETPVAAPLVSLFYDSPAANPLLVGQPPFVYFDSEDYPAEIDTPLEFFVPTGRVKMAD